ncbi:MAG: glycosyltransferase family 1 protein [Epsilonproteobacteria bacterium]|nr:glycosyltransferase family 1 protein [Campylobacterota bacterium]
MSTEDLKLCLVTDTLCDANGVSRFIQDIAKISRQKEKAFTVITSTKKNYCQSAWNLQNIKPILAFKMPFYPELDLVIPPFLKLHKEIKKRKPDLLHISTPGMLGLSALISARILKIPVMGTYHTDFPSYLFVNTKSRWIERFTQKFEKIFYKRFEGLFIRSEMYRTQLQNRLEFQKHQVHTIPAGIDTSRFDPALRDQGVWEKYGIPASAKKALFVGRVTKEKNIGFLLDLWIERYQEGSREWLVLIGSGAYYNQKEKYVQYNIRFLGHQEGKTLSTLYASADLFIFPSNTDTLGQVVIEAMASALPVLVSDIGGPQSIVNKSFFNGYVLAANQQRVWKEALNTLFSDDRKLKAMAKSALLASNELTIEKSFELFWQAQHALAMEQRGC